MFQLLQLEHLIVMYQVDTSQLSVLVEATGATTAQIQTRLQGLGGNIGIAGNLYSGPGVAVSSSGGFKLA